MTRNFISALLFLLKLIDFFFQRAIVIYTRNLHREPYLFPEKGLSRNNIQLETTSEQRLCKSSLLNVKFRVGIHNKKKN